MSTKKSSDVKIFYGEQVRKARKKLGLNQSKFAEPLGIKGNSLSDIERGVNMLTPALKELILFRY